MSIFRSCPPMKASAAHSSVIGPRKANFSEPVWFAELAIGEVCDWEWKAKPGRNAFSSGPLDFSEGTVGSWSERDIAASTAWAALQRDICRERDCHRLITTATSPAWSISQSDWRGAVRENCVRLRNNLERCRSSRFKTARVRAVLCRIAVNVTRAVQMDMSIFRR